MRASMVDADQIGNPSGWARPIPIDLPKGWLVPSSCVLGILFGCFAVTLGLGSVMMKGTAEVLRRYGGPGVIAFELARTGARVKQIFSAWGPDGKAAAINNTKWDFAFLIGYGGSLATAWLLCRGPLRDDIGSWLGPVSLVFAAMAVLAMLCDVGEDVALLAMLHKPEDSDLNLLAGVAFGFSFAKWLLASIVIAGLLPAAVTALATAFV